MTGSQRHTFSNAQYRRGGQSILPGYPTWSTHSAKSHTRSSDIPCDTCTILKDGPAQEGGHERIDDGKHDDRLFDAVATERGAVVSHIIQEKYRADRQSLQRRDPSGYTLLHIAAVSGNVVAVSSLIGLGFVSHLRDCSNIEGATPLDLCRNRMEQDRILEEEHLSTGWTGYNPDYLVVELMLRRNMGEESLLEELEDEEYIKKFRWGCTCGQCTDGWLSLRMRFRLIGPTAGAMEEEGWEDWSTQCLPEHLRLPQRPKSFGGGYRAVMGAIFELMQYFREAPTAQKVGHHLWRNWDNQGMKNINEYLSQGGTVEDALDYLTTEARQQAPLVGDGSFDRLMEKDFKDLAGMDLGIGHETDIDDQVRYGLGIQQEWRTAPRCANDLEFAMWRSIWRSLGFDALLFRYGLRVHVYSHTSL
ncbi:hypothetical protein OE88DRAFT_1387781 [Heliocybe sulcata]|uniref:Uncharacterized protein n=1 Tax=Heliocybe sulcata TaxID=5364 RepID=A0A5C3N3X3_9AGAM|nr:hypothetical protein OE88DRAFT_1387781 [Heliocybe sulcata]